jgi:hypothetical protein
MRPARASARSWALSPFALIRQGLSRGLYHNANNVNHGFVRDLFGSIIKFDAPGAGTGSGQGTFPYCFNPEGAIVGFYLDANNVYHGFPVERK